MPNPHHHIVKFNAYSLPSITPAPCRPFYLARGLYNALTKYPWQSHVHAAHKFAALASLLPLLRAMVQDPLPDRIPGVDSNDVLYAGDASYRPDAVSFAR